MKPLFLLLVLFSLLLPAMFLAAKNASAADERRLKVAAKQNGDNSKRVALIIGNASYLSSPLKNPVRDANLIGQVAQEAGFKLYGGKVHENLTYAQMLETVEGFGTSLAAGGVAMVFYAGHGMQSKGSNFLIPVDASIKAENELGYKAVNAGLILAKMEQARTRVNLLVLDACRDNPFARSFRSASGGLAAMQAPVGTLVAYSTGPGSVAEDGRGTNSIYSETLARALKQQGITIEEAFKQVRSLVRQKTRNKQTPWENTSLEGSFFFTEASETLTVQQTIPVISYVADAEKEAWNIIKESSDPEEFRAFLKEYPAGSFAGAVRLKLSRIEKKHAAEVASARLEQERLAREKQNALQKAQKPLTKEELTAGEKPELDKTAAIISAPLQPAATSLTEMQFTRVKGGCFQMGDFSGNGRVAEKPLHEVCVSDFFMGQHEVKVKDFRQFVNDTGYRTDAEKGDGCFVVDSAGKWIKSAFANWKSPGFDQTDTHPVVCVTHHDVIEFIDWLGKKNAKAYRLPTEAEWEYAARGDTTSRNYWGNSREVACGYANVADRNVKHQFSSLPVHNCDDGYLYTAPAGSFKPNRNKLYDMMGNVWEWCSDWYGEKYYAESPKNNPKGMPSGDKRVLRSGSWLDGPANVHAAYRLKSAPNNRGYNIGFRLALSAE